MGIMQINKQNSVVSLDCIYLAKLKLSFLELSFSNVSKLGLATGDIFVKFKSPK